MIDPRWLDRHSRASLERLKPRIEEKYAARVGEAEWHVFLSRLEAQWETLFGHLYRLYGQQYDFFYHLECILSTAARMWIERPDDLKALDAARSADPQWFQSHRMVAGVCYVDLFAGDLAGVREKIPWFRELGLSYLHLMPLYASPEPDNDGGYAVSSYREVDPAVGTMDELKSLATELRGHGISLCLDFVINHTSDEHAWARRALAGDPEYQEYYRMFDDRDMPDRYEASLRAIFPDEHPGCFTYRNRIRKWVWTTFHNYQWDLNYENPVVFDRMAEEMLFLANAGVEILRLDAVAFLWKRLGTSCENQPEAHWLIQAFCALVRIVAPAVVFKSEAIVHPDEVNRYIRGDECPLSYNPQLMALLWNTLATRDTRLLVHGLRKRFAIPPDCAWVNYIRCHDDIGWAFSDEDAIELGMRPGDHRGFLNRFYTGRFEGSFARGLPFQEEPRTGDARVAGTTASLAGLERALEADDAEEVDLAIRRILLLHGVILTMGGIPLFYLGDEIGMPNDYAYDRSPEKDGDSRWVHRPRFDWDRAEERSDPESVPGRIYGGLLRLIQIRKQNLAFDRSGTEIAETGNPHVFSFFRTHDEQSVLVLVNFSERPQEVEGSRLRLLGLSKTVTDLVAGRTVVATRTLTLEPYQFAVLLGVR